MKIMTFLFTLILFASNANAENPIFEILHSYKGDYSLVKNDANHRFTCGKGAFIGGRQSRALKLTLKFKNKHRAQQYFSNSIWLPTKNISTNPDILHYESVVTYPVFPLGKSSNVILAKFDIQKSKLTYMIAGK